MVHQALLWVFIPEGFLAISPGSRSAPGSPTLGITSTPQAVAAHEAATACGVDIHIDSLTGGALRDLRLIADIPPGWFAQLDSGLTHIKP